jgi:3-hydroxyacyl-CoA dehydrogenase
MKRIAVVGAGIIGASWTIVYARAGLDVAVYDRNEHARNSALDRIEAAMRRSSKLMSGDSAAKDAVARIQIHSELEPAVTDADFVHECVAENREIKSEVFRALEGAARSNAILATTSSSFGVSTFAADLPGRARCIVVHPATPPHLLPVTEIVPAPFTAQDVTDRTIRFMNAVGQVPVLVRKEVPSFVLNKLQGALLVEIFRTIREGIMSPGDIDKIISQGFGLRWAFLGPLEGIDLNAPGGIADYLGRYGFMFDQLAAEYGLPSPIVTPEFVQELNEDIRSSTALSDLERKIEWRDEAITELRALKQIKEVNKP